MRIFSISRQAPPSQFCFEDWPFCLWKASLPRKYMAVVQGIPCFVIVFIAQGNIVLMVL